MKKSDFIFLYPDVCEWVITFQQGTDKREIEQDIICMCNANKIGMLAYHKYGEMVTVYTSDKFLQFQKRMVRGASLVDLNGDKHTVISEEPFVCCGEYCIRTECNGNSDIYPCTFFNPNK